MDCVPRRAAGVREGQEALKRLRARGRVRGRVPWPWPWPRPCPCPCSRLTRERTLDGARAGARQQRGAEGLGGRWFAVSRGPSVRSAGRSLGSRGLPVRSAGRTPGSCDRTDRIWVGCAEACDRVVNLCSRGAALRGALVTRGRCVAAMRGRVIKMGGQASGGEAASSSSSSSSATAEPLRDSSGYRLSIKT